MLSDVESIAPVYVELKRRVASRQLAAEGRYALEPLLDQAHQGLAGRRPGPRPAAGGDQRSNHGLGRRSHEAR